MWVRKKLQYDKAMHNRSGINDMLHSVQLLFRPLYVAITWYLRGQK
jgi:hypothetical protein